jgi:nucleoside-diphosphate-sugar epimerase
MKLIVVGATGFVGGEVVRLALRNKSVTSIAALTRKVVPVPEYAGPEADTSKLQSVLLEDWETPYPQNVIDHLKGADACVWSVVSPARVCCAEKLMLHQVSCDNADKVQRHELR